MKTRNLYLSIAITCFAICFVCLSVRDEPEPELLPVYEGTEIGDSLLTWTTETSLDGEPLLVEINFEGEQTGFDYWYSETVMIYLGGRSVLEIGSNADGAWIESETTEEAWIIFIDIDGKRWRAEWVEE